MENIKLNRRADSISGIVDELIGEIENLENVIMDKDATIDTLNDQVTELQEEIEELKSKS